MFKLLSCLITVLTIHSFSQDQLSGYVMDALNGYPLNSVKIGVTCSIPSIHIDSTITNDSGYYVFNNLPHGIWTLHVHHAGYYSDTITNITLNKNIIMDTLFFFDSSEVLKGPISGRLTKDKSPYTILDRAWIPSNDSLEIDKGVSILFAKRKCAGGSSLTIHGHLVAIGDSANRISFGSFFTGNRWEAILFHSPAMNSGIFRYCDFRDYVCAIEACGGYSTSYLRRLEVSHCSFGTTQPNPCIRISGFSSDTQGRLSKVKISHNLFSGIGGNVIFNEASNFDSCEINYNIFASGAILRCERVYSNSSIIIDHNSFYSNEELLLEFYSETKESIFSNNLVINNMRMRIANMRAINNCFFPACDSIKPGLGYSLITNHNGDSCDFYYNIFSDPLIADSMSGLLSNSSPCIGAGTNGSNIGVYQGEGMVTNINTNYAASIQSFNNYPNPFSGTTEIFFRGMDAGMIKELSICNIKGEKIIQFKKNEMVIGSVVWRPADYPPGVYLARLRYGKNEICKKLVLVR